MFIPNFDRIHRLTSGPAEKDAPANVRSILKVSKVDVSFDLTFMSLSAIHFVEMISNK